MSLKTYYLVRKFPHSLFASLRLGEKNYSHEDAKINSFPSCTCGRYFVPS
jgi:hypothetical protein